MTAGSDRKLPMTLRSAAVDVTLVCGSLVVVFVMLELALRVLYPAPIRFLFPQESYVLDREIGYALRPGQTAYTHDRKVRINSLGLRDDEIVPEPGPGTVRIIALGDSQTFGNGLDLSETWPKQLARRLDSLGGYRWEVVNAGIPGTDTWQHEILLRRLINTLHPHAVVLALYVNDVVPRHDPSAADPSALTNTLTKRLTYLLKRSSVMTWIHSRLLLSWRGGGSRSGRSPEEIVVAGGADDLTERGWRQVEQSLQAMKRLCDARNVNLIVAILPRRDQVSGHNPGRLYNERARAIAEAHRIESLDLLPHLASAYRVIGDALFIPWDGHNSAAANAVVAAGLLPRLHGLIAVGSPRARVPSRTRPE